MAVKKGQETRQPLPGSVASTPATIERTAVAAGANRLQQFRSVQIRHDLFSIIAITRLHEQRRLWPVVGKRGWWTLQHALLQATCKPLSSGGGNPHPPKRLHGRKLRELGRWRVCKIGSIDQASLGQYPHSCMALVKRGETKIFPSMVLCTHFAHDWLSADSLLARNKRSHLGANRLCSTDACQSPATSQGSVARIEEHFEGATCSTASLYQAALSLAAKRLRITAHCSGSTPMEEGRNQIWTLSFVDCINFGLRPLEDGRNPELQNQEETRELPPGCLCSTKIKAPELTGDFQVPGAHACDNCKLLTQVDLSNSSIKEMQEPLCIASDFEKPTAMFSAHNPGEGLYELCQAISHATRACVNVVVPFIF